MSSGTSFELDDDDSARALEAALERVLDALQGLERSLDDESAALIAGGVDPLLAAVDRKRRALRAVEALLREPPLRTLLALPATPDGSDRGLGALTRLDVWPRLREQLARLRTLNQAAGGAIAATRRGTDEMLRVLGHAPEPATYAVDGSVRGSDGRDLAVC